MLHFPAEILDLIIDGCYRSACMLWLCGNKNLNYRLAYGGIQHLELVDGWSCDSPNLLRSFRQLRHLTFGFYELHPNRTPNLLLSLPPTLESLCITGIRVDTLFLENEYNLSSFFDSNADTEILLSYIDSNTSSSSAISSSKREPRIIDMRKRFPNLRRLVVDVIGHMEWTNDDFVFLPPNLIEFSYTGSTRQSDSLDISNLPRSIQLLRLPKNTLTTTAFAQLPPSLTHLDELILTPTNLEDAISSAKDLVNIVSGIKFSDSQVHWPSTLTSISFHNYHNIGESLLQQTFPAHLTCLRVTCGPSTVSGVLLKQSLPATLTELSLFYIDWSTVTLTDWPPRLASLEARNSLKFSLSCFAALPRSLTRLNISFKHPLNDESHDMLQNTGRNILASVDYYQMEMLRAAFKHGQARKSGPESISEALLKEIENGRLLGLPLTLRHLHFDCTDNLIFPHVLPPFTETLTIHGLRLLTSDFQNFVRLLPPTMRKLRVNTPQTNHVPHKPDDRALDWPSYTSSILTTLDLSDSLINPQQLGLLPRSLLQLQIRSFSTITSMDSLAQLPPRLLHLVIEWRFTVDGNNADFNNQSREAVDIERSSSFWLGKLPRSLVRLQMAYASAHGSDLQNLPPHLESLTLCQIHNVTLTHINAIPKTVQVLRACFLPPPNCQRFDLLRDMPVSHHEFYNDEDGPYRPFPLLKSDHRFLPPHLELVGTYAEEPYDQLIKFRKRWLCKVSNDPQIHALYDDSGRKRSRIKSF